MKRAAVLTIVGLLALGALPLQAAAPANSSVTLSWADFVKITGYDATMKGNQTLTVPWAEVEALLGVKVDRVGKGTTVALPWTEFKTLLQWSIDTKAGKAIAPPTDYIVSASEYSGALTDKTADLSLKLSINILREKGWKRIPVLSGKVALTKTTLPAGVFLNVVGDKYELLTDKTGAMEIVLAFSTAVTESKGIHQVSIPRVAPGTSIIDVSVDREDVDVKIPSAQSLVAKKAGGKTQVAAAMPSGAPLSITWERALPEVAKAPTKLYAETRTLIAVAEGVLLCTESVTFNILHTPVRELTLKVPADTSVLTVTGSNVQDWRVDDKGALQVVLQGEVIGAQTLSITYEKAAGDTVSAPVIQAVGVEREKGFIGVVALSNVEIAEGEVKGARTIDARQLPGELVAMTKQPVLVAFRTVGQDFDIPLTIKKHGEIGVLVTIVDSALFTAMQLNDGRRMTKVVYNVRNNRNQFLRLKMPEGVDIWSVEVNGKTVAPAKDDTGNILLPLVRSSAGARELASFPVEMVYVETPTKPVAAKGALRVDLPTVNAPVMHLMVSYYLPTEGTYRSYWSGDRFDGPLKLVEGFTQLVAGAGREVVAVNAEGQAKDMQQRVSARADQRAKAAGAEPIRVRLPINGKLFRLEKILALPNDPLWFSVGYSGWETER
ncbi:hypothetical protein HQ560_17780 [bacterium]|nr:hypothetical protein [bacterium]